MRFRLTSVLICFTGILLMLLVPGKSLFSQTSETTTPKFNERRVEIKGIIPQSRVVINIPSVKYLKKSRETRVIFYALPNGNSIEQTEGANIRDSAIKARDWRFDIQHIAAQVRFLRVTDKRFNYIVVYLESETKAWTSHASAHQDSPRLYPKLIDSVKFLISKMLPEFAPLSRQRVTLASHSGGGRFVFNFIKSQDMIPADIERFAFIDSNYGYEKEVHSGKLLNWLADKDCERYLGLFAYVDTTVILDGKRIVSSTGGTGYRANLMASDFKSEGLALTEKRDTAFVSYRGESVEILIKENPKGKIFHTVLVERNGLIHMLLSGSAFENRKYRFWEERCYNRFIEERAPL